MIQIVTDILDWSEVWALLIPLIVLGIRRKQPSYFKPVIVYIWLALFLDILIDLGSNFKEFVPGWIHPNNYIYNIHSIVRFICFGYFFILLKQPFFTRLKKTIPFVSLVFIIINFIILKEDFFKASPISSRLFSVEAGLLLLYCILYYLYTIHSENTTSHKEPHYWVVIGLSTYVVFNFPYFLFYSSLITNHIAFVLNMWYFHNITFIILCIFIAKAFYVSRRN